MSDTKPQEFCTMTGMTHRDDDLTDFDANGGVLPSGGTTGTVDTGGARIWYASFGAGPPVILLHGGMGNSGNFAHQVPAIVAAGYTAIVIDSRGHGRSTRDDQPYSYQLLAQDVRAVMDRLSIASAAIVGWSDGADTGLVMAHDTPDRVTGLFFFACNVDSTGTKPFVFTDAIGRCLSRHKKDYAALSPTPDGFDAMSEAVGAMQSSQPNYTAADLAAVSVPVVVAQAEHDEFIEPSHAAYIATTIPGAALIPLAGVSHFAPVQRPEVFNPAMLAFLAKVAPLR